MSYPNAKHVALTALVLAAMLLCSTRWAGAQQTDGQDQSGAVPAAGQAPLPGEVAFPPLSGLDESSLEPNVAARSYLAPGAQVSEFVDSNAANSLNRKGSSLVGVTHLLGSLALEKLWRNYASSLNYIGGGALYSGGLRQDSQVHELGLDTRVQWRTGQLAFRDRASYMPEGTFAGGAGFGGFGSELGGLGGVGVGATSGGNRFAGFGLSEFGALGTIPKLSNLSIVDVTQSLTPRTSMTLAGGFNYLHFTKATGGLLIDSQQVTGQAGYNHILDRRNQISVIYGYQHFHFPVASGASFETNVAQFVYGHQISGRMELVLGAGPQLTDLKSVTGGNTLRLSASARASLRYRFPRTSVAMSYARYNSAAEGIFAGATTDLAYFTVNRPLGRRWESSARLGYSHNHRLQQITQGANANTYNSIIGGLRMTRILTRSFRAFAFYGYNDFYFDRSFCGINGPCSRNSTRQVGGVGLTWQPTPIRLD